jgi:hypothetical protein
MTERERQREKERILVLFEAHREAPGTAFDESHFLDFLLAAPARRRAVYDSVDGMRRLDAFFDHVQLEYSVCFSHAERGANEPLDAFVARTLALVETPRASWVAFHAGEKPVFRGPVAVIGNLLLLIPVLMLVQVPWAAALVVVFALVLNGLWFGTGWRHARYRERLRRQLVEADATRRKLADRKRIEALG